MTHVSERDRSVWIGCAGWSIPRVHADHFPGNGSHLARYGGQLPAVEINSSFYGPHRPQTYARWAAETPDYFRFAVKVPKEITHTLRLVGTDQALDAFLAEISPLGVKLGPLLIQLPPSLAFSSQKAEAFFHLLRDKYGESAVCEPRHPSWFENEPDHLLQEFKIARVAADPARVLLAAVPGGWLGLQYYRMHGSPRMYYSEYGLDRLRSIAAKIAVLDASVERWCIFDNTASGAAAQDAVDLMALCSGQGTSL